jgi:hypothetical protein
MNVPLTTKPALNNESGESCALSDPSQPLSLYTLPLTPGQCFVIHTPVNACLGIRALPAMPVNNNGTLFMLAPCLDHSQQRSCATFQFEYQHIGLDLECLPCNLTEPQTLDNNMWMATAASQATPPNELLSMANGGIPPSTFLSPTITRSQAQSPTSLLAAQDSALDPLSPEAYKGLQPRPDRQSQRPACPLLNCGTTFKRAHELKRHIATVHGLKENCPYNSCRYKTGRKDKMVEHARKMHRKV